MPKRIVQPGMTYDLGQGRTGQVWSKAKAESNGRGYPAWLVVSHSNGEPNRFALAFIERGGHGVNRWQYQP